MPEINILSPHVADMIAAGEVVERPASVIKELVENSLDAGAKNVTVEIRDGGATYIRVSDDGCGMAPEDAGVAFLRHATSKLRDERGLEAIGTMGFRGEALAAISAVSEIELRTRRRGDAEGTAVTLAAGDIQEMGAAGCPEGTTLTVSRLFYNTPARLKFLKSDRSEASACVSAALRCALGHPELSLRLIKDGREEFFSPGDGRMDSCLYALLGRDIAADMLSVESESQNMSVRGFASSPSAGRGNRSAQYFYCNGRFIKSALLQSAVEQAYKNTLLTGRYPACVLYITMSCAAVDVNVHPAKTEVKFAREREVFDLVYNAVRSALEREDRAALTADPDSAQAPAAAIPGPSRKTPEALGAAVTAAQKRPAASRQDFFKSMSAGDYRRSVTETKPVPQTRTGPAPENLRSFHMPYQAASATKNLEITGTSTAFERITVEKPVQNVESQSIPDHKIVGEALKTYIIVEVAEGLLLIDKHAAHERMIFDRLKKQERQIMSQSLLSPVTLRLDGADRELVEQNGELLAELGFELEPYGEREYVIRALPADMLPEDAAAAVEEICEKLRSGTAPDAASARDAVLHTVACKAAIKAGFDSSPMELERIAVEVLSGRVKYCPHGRPVCVPVSRRELEKLFKRIV